MDIHADGQVHFLEFEQVVLFFLEILEGLLGFDFHTGGFFVFFQDIGRINQLVPLISVGKAIESPKSLAQIKPGQNDRVVKTGVLGFEPRKIPCKQRTYAPTDTNTDTQQPEHGLSGQDIGPNLAKSIDAWPGLPESSGPR